jgi:hypothetical protein
MSGFVLMLFSGSLYAQAPQGGVNAKSGNNKPQVSAKSHAGMQKHEKMKTQGNDVKLQQSSASAKGDAKGEMNKPKPKPKAKPKKSSK